MTDLLFRGGTVFTGYRQVPWDLRVVDGVVHTTGSLSVEPGTTLIDVTGMYVLPGAVDLHVHSRDPGFPEKEDFASLTAAAAAGGVTTVIDMPNTVPAIDSAGMLESKAALVRPRARVDFGFWGLVRSTSTEDQLRGLAAAGAIGFKAYLGYVYRLSQKQVLYSVESSGTDLEAPPDYGTLARLGPVLAELGLPLAIHAEDPDILRAFRRPFATYEDVLAARPPEAEAVAIAAASAVARQFGFRLHIAHLSSELGLAAVEEARNAGANITAETCPTYLWLTQDDFPRLGTAMKILPPVRTIRDRTALRDGLKRGAISVIATDHAPHTNAEKARDLDEAPPGSPGVQTLYLSALQLAKEMGNVWLAPEWVAEGPAGLAGIDKTKGWLGSSTDADLVIVDPNATTTFVPSWMRSKQRHDALSGMTVDFAIKSVYRRGVEIYANGRLAAKAGGRIVRPVGVAIG